MSAMLGAELIHKTLWYPTILGILVVVAGIALFCGSVYVLLATNLGARLGFLVAFTALMGLKKPPPAMAWPPAAATATPPRTPASSLRESSLLISRSLMNISVLLKSKSIKKGSG